MQQARNKPQPSRADFVPLSQEVSKTRRCQLCKGESGCRYHPDTGDFSCNLHSNGKLPEVEGFTYVGRTLNGFNVFAKHHQPRPEPEPQEAENNGGSGGWNGPKDSKRKELLDDIRDLMGDHLRFNQLTNLVEFNGEPFRVETYYLELLDKYDLNGGKDMVTDWLVHLAKKRSYSPVVEYLEKCYAEHKDTTLGVLGTIAARYFGSASELHQTYVTKTLIGAVARALDPGCKQETALILQGAQGVGKSSFFRVLAEPWFDDSFGAMGDKDERLKLHSSWFIEWAELENVFKRKDVSAVKSFLSSQYDVLRVPYGRSVERFPRACVIVGSTNQDEFLTDPTGARRFWVLPVSKPVDWQSLKLERDEIWSAAVHLYKTGHPFILTKEEGEASARQNLVFETTHPWLIPIKDWLQEDGIAKHEIRINDILNHCLKIELSRQGRSEQMQVADCLKRLGWKKRQTREGSVWVSPERQQMQDYFPEDGQKGIQGIHGIQNRLPESGSSVNTLLIPQERYSQNNGEYLLIPDGEVSTSETLTQSEVCIPCIPLIPSLLEAKNQGEFQSGDRVRIEQNGQFYGMPATVVAVQAAGVEVRAKRWQLTRVFQPAELKLLERGGKPCP